MLLLFPGRVSTTSRFYSSILFLRRRVQWIFFDCWEAHTSDAAAAGSCVHVEQGDCHYYSFGLTYTIQDGRFVHVEEVGRHDYSFGRSA